MRHVGRPSDKPTHVVGGAPLGDVRSGRFRKRIDGGLLRSPLLGEQVDAVLSDHKRLTVEIGGLRLRSEIGLVFVRKPYRIHHKGLIQKRFLADAQNVQVLPHTAVVADVAEVQIEAVLRHLFCVVVAYSADTQCFCSGCRGAVEPVQTAVVVVVVGPVATIPEQQ